MCRLERLRPGIVEPAGLADNDRAGADEEDRFYVGSLGHGYLVNTFNLAMNFRA